MRTDSPGIAYALNRRAIEIDPSLASAYHNIGKIFHDKVNDDAADEWFRKAVKVKPNFPNSLEGLSMSAIHRGDWKSAIDYANRALAEDHDHRDAKVNRGMAYLALKRWREGWRDFDANLGADKNRKEMVYGSTPRWDGSKGKNVVVYGEQGLGDEINFASCIPDLIRDSKSVTIECTKRNLAIFKRSFPTCEVHGTLIKSERSLETRVFDGKVAMGALPGFYRLKDADFHGTPYLVPNPDHRRVWRSVLDSLGPRPKIGLAWTGGIPKTGQHRRSVSIDTYAHLFGFDADWVSLQYKDYEGIPEAEKKYGVKIHDWELGTRNKDYDQTVALIAELDLVISVCTAVVDAAGAIGKECWCLVPEIPLWRHAGEGRHYPWASSVSLWRQKNKQWPIIPMFTELREKFSDRSRDGRRESASAVKESA